MKKEEHKMARRPPPPPPLSALPDNVYETPVGGNVRQQKDYLDYAIPDIAPPVNTNPSKNINNKQEITGSSKPPNPCTKPQSQVSGAGSSENVMSRIRNFQTAVGETGHSQKIAIQPKLRRNITETPGVYTDAESEVNLSIYNWFHGKLERDEAMKMVEQLGRNGDFLIRESENVTHPYTIVVFLESKAENVKIRLRNDHCFAIGNEEKPDEVSFASLHKLVEHHRENNIKLAYGRAVKLSKTPSKKK